MSKLLIVITIVLSLLISLQTSSARTLVHPPIHNYNKITFLMRDIFNVSTKSVGTSSDSTNYSPKTKPSTTRLTNPNSNGLDIPFSKPLGLFPPKGASLVPQTGIALIGLPFPAKATLQELELGVVTDIEEDIFHPNLGYKSQLLGKAIGMFVASSEDGRSHMMMAMEVKLLGDDNKDNNGGESGLRFFGVKKSDVNESHIAVIGGIGKYKGANGYATVERMTEKGRENKLLKFNVYLS